MIELKIIAGGGVTSAKGFAAGGIAAGIKGGKRTKKDLAMIYSESATTAAAVFTLNLSAAAPVQWCRSILQGNPRLIVCNSGNANACTGNIGLQVAEEMATTAGNALNLPKESVFVASTGVIGVQMPKDVIYNGIKLVVKNLRSDLTGGHNAAEAIMTTDTVAKEIAVEFILDGQTVTIGGMAKGSGMIHPNMATMLGFITTDAAVEKAALESALKQAADISFNMVSVDGDTSTNDSLFLLANGQAGNQLLNQNSSNYAVFTAALDYVCQELAKMIAGDGEGATKFLQAEVYEARSQETAKKVAKSVISSSLVKAAFFGEDANWGRIICAIGYAGAELEIDKVDISLASAGGEEMVMQAGAGLLFDEVNAKKILTEKKIRIIINLHDGDNHAVAWGCDLSYDYVKINGDYRS